ncbi:hypothetical protein [Streptomyces sp. NPDC002547]
MATPPPNPYSVHPNEHPDHLAARQARADFEVKAKEIRDSRAWSDIYKAEKLAGAYQDQVKAIQDAYGRVVAARQARLDHITGLVPSGPGIPDDTSPADRQLLVTAYRSHLAAAQSAKREDRARLLAEAEKYGDDLQARAVLTAAVDQGDTGLLNDWVARTHDLKGWSDERAQLDSGIGRGPGNWSGWDYKDFHTPQMPPEVAAAIAD